MAVHYKPRYTPDQYLDMERAADHKSEYSDGEIFAMAGASEEHNLVGVNLVREISTQLRGTLCRTYANDMRVKVEATGLFTYPDVVIVCGERRFADDHLDTLTNPTVVIEVLSPTTEGYDRGRKFANYRRIPSLQAYVLVSQDQALVECYERQENGQWALTEARGLDASLALPAVTCTLALADVYADIDFDSAPPFAMPDPNQPR
jgi:Uma2 family endonuclease